MDPARESTSQLRRIEELAAVQARIAEAGADVDAVLELVAEQARRLTGADGAAVEMVEGDEIVYRAAVGSAAPFVGLRLDLRQSLSGAAALSGRPLFCPDSEADDRVDREAARKVGARSMILQPLLRGGRGVGVLKVMSAEPHRFDDGDGHLLGVVAGLMAASIAAAEQSRRLQALFEAAPDAIFAADREGRLTLWSPSAERLYGWREEEVLGSTFPMVPQTEAESHRSRFVDLLEGEASSWEAGHRARDGSEIAVAVSAAPRRDAEGRVMGAVFFARDVAERNRLQEELTRARKLEGIGRLAGGVAHDFNNMLTAITGFGKLLIDDDSLSEDQRESVAQILEAARRSSYITHQLLAYSRQQVLDPRPVDLNQVIEEMRGVVGHLLGKSITLDLRLDDDLPTLLADKGQIEQVVLNLLVNAKEAIAPEPGRVTIRTEMVVVEEGDEEREIPAGRYVRLTVRDSGRGIPEEIRAHIFEPFYTTKELYQGTGLGLATVDGIVYQCGGHVAVESEEGEGTTFRIHLPVTESAAPGADAPVTGSSAPVATVLVVEDEDAVRRLVVRILEEAGHTVIAASLPGEALALMEDRGGDVDLVVSDVVMPEMTGFQLVETLRESRPSLPALFVSGYVEDELERDLPEEGARFLAKPFRPDDLTGAVADLVREAGPVRDGDSVGEGGGRGKVEEGR